MQTEVGRAGGGAGEEAGCHDIVWKNCSLWRKLVIPSASTDIHKRAQTRTHAHTPSECSWCADAGRWQPKEDKIAPLWNKANCVAEILLQRRAAGGTAKTQREGGREGGRRISSDSLSLNPPPAVCLLLHPHSHSCLRQNKHAMLGILKPQIRQCNTKELRK